jgi:hypothetical protein
MGNGNGGKSDGDSSNKRRRNYKPAQLDGERAA